MDLFGLIGRPLTHSFSAEFFNEKFSREGIDASYRNFELPDIGDIMELLAELPELQGFNVTIPYKEAILPYLTSISPEAKEIGAVNVVRLRHDSQGNVTALEGFNTDCPAFARTLAPLLPLRAVKALVLGSGGASKAVGQALQALGVEHIIVSRTPAPGRLTYADLSPEVMNSHQVIVNATPLGTFPNVDTCPPIPYEFVSPAHVCYDLVYNPAQTKFLKLCADHGASTRNGLDMLHLQALLAWQIWQR